MDNLAVPIPSILPQPTVSAPEKSTSRRWLLWSAVGLAILTLGIAIGIFSAKFFSQSPSPSQLTSTPTASPSPQSPTPSLTPDPTASWSIYKNDKAEFSLKYPADKLVSCSYSNTKGLRLWQAPFGCPDGHDIFYEIAVIENLPGEYKEYKNPSSIREINVNGIKATEKVYVYEDMDGPLQSLGQSTEILIENNGYTIQIQFLDNSPDRKSLFAQILSTFKFLD